MVSCRQITWFRDSCDSKSCISTRKPASLSGRLVLADSVREWVWFLLASSWQVFRSCPPFSYSISSDLIFSSILLRRKLWYVVCWAYGRVKDDYYLYFAVSWLNTCPSLSQPSMDSMKCLSSYFTEITEAAVSNDSQIRQVSNTLTDYLLVTYELSTPLSYQKSILRVQFRECVTLARCIRSNWNVTRDSFIVSGDCCDCILHRPLSQLLHVPIVAGIGWCHL